ncbi:phage tail tape measure protein [Iodobacter arcticus]|uniref:Phage tail tape measure protein n=1 Tax=Iodobacter arcticus TaxID=590593 RepID=A0ABW2QUF9_9NEIS
MADLLVGIRIGAALTGSFRAAFAGARGTLDQLGQTVDQVRTRHARLGDAMARAATHPARNVDALRRQYERLGRTLEQLRIKQEKLSASLEQGAVLSAARSELNGEAMEALAVGGAVALPIAQAIAFEDAMLGVAKQVQGARDDAGKLTPLYFEMGHSIQALGRRIPLVTNEIAKLVEGGARMGVQGKENLLIFAEQTAMMASAFDIPTEQIAESMGKVATLYKIPIPAIGKLADTINYLDDNTITKGGDLINFMERTAGVIAMVKMSAKEAAALGSTFLTLGETRETASTAVNAIIGTFASAESGTKAFRSAVRELGLAPIGLQKGMQTDAMGTLIKVSNAIAKLPKDKRVGVMIDMVGKEHFDTFSKLVDNPLELAKQRQLANSPKAQGSMQKEMNARKDTTSAQWLMFQNRLSELTVNLGTILLPTINQIMGGIGSMVSKMADWTRAHPAVTHAIVGTVAALAGLKVISFGIRYAVNVVMSQFNALQTIFNTITAKWTQLVALWQSGYFSPLISRLASIGNSLRVGFQLALPWLRQAGMMLLRLSPIGLALSVVGLLIYKYWQPIKGFFIGLWQGLSSVAGPALKALIQSVTSFAKSVWALILAIPGVGVSIRMIGIVAKPIFNVIIVGVRTAYTWFKKLIAPIDDVGGKAQNMGQMVGVALGGIVKGLFSLPTQFFKFGGDIVDGLVNGIKSKLGAAEHTITQFGQNIKGWFASTLGIQSPSRVFLGFGDNIAQGAALGIGRSAVFATRAVAAMAQASATAWGKPELASPFVDVANRVASVVPRSSGHEGPNSSGGMTVHFSPQITVQGGDPAAVQGQVNQALQSAYPEFEKMMKRYESNKKRGSYGGNA